MHSTLAAQTHIMGTHIFLKNIESSCFGKLQENFASLKTMTTLDDNVPYSAQEEITWEIRTGILSDTLDPIN